VLILAIDSTAVTASVALCDGEKVLGQVELNLGNKHSTTVLPAVEFLLSEAGKSVSDVEMFALTAGPGSFTGVRIGAATVKGLAFGRKVPVVGVSSLETMAEGMNSFDGVICPLINARRDRYFTAFFESNRGVVTRLSEDDTLSGDEICERLTSADHAYILGDGAEIFLRSHGGIAFSIAPDALMYPSAAVIAKLAMRRYESATDKEKDSFTADSLRPIYLRQPQAERELAERTAASAE